MEDKIVELFRHADERDKFYMFYKAVGRISGDTNFIAFVHDMAALSYKYEGAMKNTGGK
jgi:hypothetical protein